VLAYETQHTVQGYAQKFGEARQIFTPQFPAELLVFARALIRKIAQLVEKVGEIIGTDGSPPCPSTPPRVRPAGGGAGLLVVFPPLPGIRENLVSVLDLLETLLGAGIVGVGIRMMLPHQSPV